MRYKVGDTVVLRDDLVVGRNYGEGAVVFIEEMEGYVGEEEKITHLVEEEDLYTVNERWLISDDMIDHSKTAELKKDKTLNHYSNEVERVVAEKNKIHQESAVETKYTADKIDRHKELTDYMHQTYIRKNKDYGDSFGQTHDKYGAVAGLVRIADKFHRLENIILNDREIQVEEESVIDTLIDMSNYGLLLAMELEEGK